MKPSDRFAKKVWKKPPKEDTKGYKIAKKTGLGRCAICKGVINSRKKYLLKDKNKITSSDANTNRPYGGYLCSKCFREQIIKETQNLETEA